MNWPGRILRKNVCEYELALKKDFGMNSLLIGFCVAMLLNFALGQGSFAGSEIAKIHPDHQDKCLIEETQMSYSPGEKFITKSGCREATCTNYEDHLILLYRGCPYTRRQTNCKYITKNPELEFPGCCPDQICN